MKKSDEIIKTVEEVGLMARGKRELLKHLYGERLTIRQMAIAKCYSCMGYYSDGTGADCEIPECPLYPIMPYQKLGEKYVGKKGTPMSDEHKEKLRVRMKAMAASKKNRLMV